MKLKLLLFLTLLITTGIGMSCRSNDNVPSQNTRLTSQQTYNKISSQLSLQLKLRENQIESPSLDRLNQMQKMGMNTTELNIQRIFIYLKKPLSPSQIAELQSLGIVVYPDSWIPPVGNNLAGFVLATLPVDKVNDLVSQEYIIRVDTAENSLSPQFNNSGDSQNLR
jgi:hypothetical protein